MESTSLFMVKRTSVNTRQLEDGVKIKGGKAGHGALADQN